MAYSGGIETPEIFRFWIATTIISATLRRSVFLESSGDQAGTGYPSLRTHPNIYVILVAEPGEGKKTGGINVGAAGLEDNDYVNVVRDRVTPESLIKCLADFVISVPTPSGGQRIWTENQAYIIASELGLLVSKDKYNDTMLTVLCNIYDGTKGGSRTVSRAPDKLDKVSMTIIAGCTPMGLATQVPEHFFGMGFASRCIFVFADAPDRLVAYPRVPSGVKPLTQIKQELLDLGSGGGAAVVEGALSIEWYTQWYENRPPRRWVQRSMDEYYARKPQHLRKLALLLTVAEGLDEVMVPCYEQALALLEYTEADMPNALTAIGMSIKGRMITMARRIVQKEGTCEFAFIMRRVQQYMDKKELQTALETLIASQEIENPSPDVYTWRKEV